MESGLLRAAMICRAAALEGFSLEEDKAGHITKAELRRWLALETALTSLTVS